MDFALSGEQEMLRDNARRFLAGSFEKGGAPGAAWADYAELGWLALAVPEDAAGLGGSIEDLVLLAEEMGRSLSPEPFVASAVLAIRLIDRIAVARLRAPLLERLASGSLQFVPALYEPTRRYDTEPTTTAVKNEAGFLLSGAKVMARAGGADASFLVPAKLADKRIALFAVPPETPSLSLRTYPAIDGSLLVDLDFQGMQLSADALLGETDAFAIEDAIDEARICICADTLGGLEHAIEMTVEYLKTRVQFGQRLADFQVLQHSLVEMHIDTDKIRSSLYQAIAAFGASSAQRRKAVSGCWVTTYSAAKSIAGMAIHLHGGVGMTTQYRVGHYLRRIMVAERSYGDVEHHLARYMS